MTIYQRLFDVYANVAKKIRFFDFVVLLAIRCYLAPVFIVAGLNKAMHFNATVEWFGNSAWGLGLPLPAVMAALAIFAEVAGGFALLLGWFTRVFALLLSVTMIVAAATVHWKNGWFAIAPSEPSSSIASLLAKIGLPGAEASLANSEQVGQRLQRARGILQEYGNYDWLTESGNFVVLNNGVEFAVTYLLMLLVLLCLGAGRWLSVDYWLTPRQRFLQPR